MTFQPIVCICIFNSFLLDKINWSENNFSYILTCNRFCSFSVPIYTKALVRYLLGICSRSGFYVRFSFIVCQNKRIIVGLCILSFSRKNKKPLVFLSATLSVEFWAGWNCDEVLVVSTWGESCCYWADFSGMHITKFVL